MWPQQPQEIGGSGSTSTMLWAESCPFLWELGERRGFSEAATRLSLSRHAEGKWHPWVLTWIGTLSPASAPLEGFAGSLRLLSSQACSAGLGPLSMLLPPKQQVPVSMALGQEPNFHDLTLSSPGPVKWGESPAPAANPALSYLCVTFSPWLLVQGLRWGASGESRESMQTKPRTGRGVR